MGKFTAKQRDHSEKTEGNKRDLIQVVSYDRGGDCLVWKYPEDSICLGSQLIVHETQEALFLRDGRALDLFGAGRYTLNTGNLPMMGKLYKIPTEGDSIFQAEVYFVNLVTQMGIKWGTDSKVRLFDPSSGLYMEVGASGTFSLRVIDSRRLIVKVVGKNSEFTTEEINGIQSCDAGNMMGKFRALIVSRIKTQLARTIKKLQINILEIDSYLDELSENIRDELNSTLEKYGLEMPEFYVTTVLLPDEDPNFRRLKQQFADRTLLIRQEEILKAEAEASRQRKMVEAETNAGLRMIQARGEAQALKIEAEAKAEGYRMQALAEAEEMQAKGYSYQQETARQVGLEAMKNGLIGQGSENASGGLGDIAGLGVTLGAMGELVGMTKETLRPIMGQYQDIGKSMGQVVSGNGKFEENMDGIIQNAGKQYWNCSCGASGLTGRFCPECGTARTEVQKKEEE